MNGIPEMASQPVLALLEDLPAYCIMQSMLYKPEQQQTNAAAQLVGW